MAVSMGVWAALAAVVIGTVQVSWGFVQPQPTQPIQPDPVTLCKVIKFSDPSRRTAERESVLRKVCEQGVEHVEFRNPNYKQFAVFNLHRDSFSDTPAWHSGDAENVIADPYWSVNDVEQLPTSRYHWYSNGLPMWPLPYQALPNVTKPKLLPLSRKKPSDWPNYGLATPIYFATNTWRSQEWSAEEFFQLENQKKKSKFVSSENFHKLAKTMVAEVDATQVESYSEWPFLKFSLEPMVKSMVKRNKGLCPDEFFMYMRMTPCLPRGLNTEIVCAQAALAATTILTQAGCRSTNVIVGYTEDYIVNDIEAPIQVVKQQNTLRASSPGLSSSDRTSPGLSSSDRTSSGRSSSGRTSPSILLETTSVSLALFMIYHWLFAWMHI